MTPIKNKTDFRRGYEFMDILTEALAANGFGKPELIREEIINTKRELRAYSHKDNTFDAGLGFMCERRIVKDAGMDGYMELVSIPDVFITFEEAEKFFEEFIEISAIPSMYDCTGQAFTNWYKIFKRRGQFWAYHSVGFDV